MGSLNPSDAYLIEKAIDPNSMEYKYLMDLLLSTVDDGTGLGPGLKKAADWKYVFPFKGEPEAESEVRSVMPYRFSDRGRYRNGVGSLSIVTADVIDLIEVASSARRLDVTLVVSEESETVKSTLASSGSLSPVVLYSRVSTFVEDALECRPQTVVFDHTTACMPVDDLLNSAYRLGVHIVDGVFPYHVAGVRGWDIVSGLGKWSYTHGHGCVTVGPDDDSARMVTYDILSYKKFTDPSLWQGNSRKYGFEIRKLDKGLATYRAVYLGLSDAPLPDKNLSYLLPVCSSDEMVMITINRDLAAGVYTSQSNNAMDLTKLQKNYAIEMRRDLFVSCVDFLVAKEKGSDIVGESIRYIAQHNYVDLMDGVKVVRAHSLKYADALCAAIVCALVSYGLRYRLTSESVPDIQRTVKAAQLAREAPLGALGRLAWLFYTSVSDSLYKTYDRSRARAAQMLRSTDYIPGVCYDVYVGTAYTPDLDWFEPYHMEYERDEPLAGTYEKDAFTSFMGESEKTSAPTARSVKQKALALPEPEKRYAHNKLHDPVSTLQNFYDAALPGNSVAQIQGLAELRRVKNVDIITEFYGKIEIGKDIAAPERLHEDTAIRTASVPISRTPLVDAIMAASKRNFNPPDLQDQNDPWTYAEFLVNKFIDWAFKPGYREHLGKRYKQDPVTFSVNDYIEWRATRDSSYRSALEAECPEEMVELGLERYDTIVKKRIKPKLSTVSQFELAQPQVLVNMSKKDTALFSSVFRRMFERMEGALRSEIMSAGRASDDVISTWLTENWTRMQGLEALELDSSKYDKSQGLLARMIESLLMIELGLDPGVLDIFQDSWVGKVSSRALGLMFVSSYQMKSGAPHTMLGNVIYNFVSAMESVGPQNIVFMIVKGDDNIVWVRTTLDKELIVSRMSSLFNLEVKLLAGRVLYFSSGYVVPLDDVTLFVPDPLKAVELLGEPTPDARTIKEQFVSFADKVRSMVTHHALPAALQTVVRHRLGVPDLDVVSTVDALASLASDFGLYEVVKGALKFRAL